MCPRVGAHQRKNTPSGVFFSVIHFTILVYFEFVFKNPPILYWLISSFFKIRLVLLNKSKGFAGDFYNGILCGALVSEFSPNPELL